MRVASEGWPFIRAAVGMEAGLLVVWYAWPGWTVALPAVGALLVAWLFVFFRDPDRDGPRGEQLVIAPADGRVCAIARVQEAMYLHGTATRVSIFMSVFDVHVNRYPVSGEIEIVHYNPGEFTVASHDKASLVNEQASIGIRAASGPLLVRQIAGFIARRIVTDGSPGDQAVQGRRMGMIRFGSRVDVFFDPRAVLRVAVGDAVLGGRTVIAELPA